MRRDDAEKFLLAHRFARGVRLGEIFRQGRKQNEFSDREAVLQKQLHRAFVRVFRRAAQLPSALTHGRVGFAVIIWQFQKCAVERGGCLEKKPRSVRLYRLFQRENRLIGGGRTREIGGIGFESARKHGTLHIAFVRRLRLGEGGARFGVFARDEIRTPLKREKPRLARFV